MRLAQKRGSSSEAVDPEVLEHIAVADTTAEEKLMFKERWDLVARTLSPIDLKLIEEYYSGGRDMTELKRLAGVTTDQALRVRISRIRKKLEGFK